MKPFLKQTLKLILYFIVIHLTSSEVYSQECGDNVKSTDVRRHGLPHPTEPCNIDGIDEKCIRIKFHYVNNTTSTSQSPSDVFFAELLNELNKAYKNSKIQFTFENQCVHRVTQYMYEGTDPGENPFGS